jgi:DNA-3-methyladenine glycosylase II
MSGTTITEETLPRALEALATLDSDMRRALDEVGPPPLRARPAGFDALMRIIIGQQVSVASAQAIWDRLAARCGAVTPAAFLALSDDDFQEIGFSRQKKAYGRSLAELLASGALDLSRLDALDDEAAVAEITKVKGLGRWSAQCYLLFSHGRPDVLPADDLGLMIGAQKLKGLDARPDAKALAQMGEAWRPWRSVAARMLWHYRRTSGIAD